MEKSFALEDDSDKKAEKEQVDFGLRAWWENLLETVKTSSNLPNAVTVQPRYTPSEVGFEKFNFCALFPWDFGNKRLDPKVGIKKSENGEYEILFRANRPVPDPELTLIKEIRTYPNAKFGENRWNVVFRETARGQEEVKEKIVKMFGEYLKLAKRLGPF